ncbi:MAG TPA: tetratricopeptide repeat protein [Puia sp.]|nr:tetratricopeptide repeat protein [Puia sp.]
MSQNKEQILIDYLDSSLQGAAPITVAQLIREDQDMAATWLNLQLSVDIIREAGLRERVARIRRQYEQNRSASGKPAVVRRLNYKLLFRAAACVILLAGAAILYKYSTTTPEMLYSKYYTTYDLGTSRGEGHAEAMERAYRQKQWEVVLSLQASSKETDNKTLFLSGMAAMELKKYNQAIEDFQQVLNRNLQTRDTYFQDEAEYYLAMSYLASQQTDQAITILTKIRADKNHLFYKRVHNMSSLDWEILRYKGRK